MNTPFYSDSLFTRTPVAPFGCRGPRRSHAFLALLLFLLLGFPGCDDGDGCLEGAFGGQCDNQSGTRPKEDVLADASADLLDEVGAEIPQEVEAPKGTYPHGASDKQIEALGYVNDIRFADGLGPINKNSMRLVR